MRILNDSKFVIPFFLGLICLFSFLLYRNFSKKSGDSENPPIGVVTFKTKTVLRKYDDQVVWDTIESSTQVKNRDTIRTEDFSDAVLTLNDGTKINISENSMILLDISEKNININFAYGSFEAERDKSATGDSKMKIQSGDKTVEVGKGDVKLDKTKSELNVKVGEGEAKITSNGVEETIQKNQVASANDTGVRVSKPRFSLLAPEDKQNFFSDDGKEMVSFSISGLTPEIQRDAVPFFELSNSPDFTRIVTKERLKTANFSRSLNSGAFYWRLSYTDPESKLKSNTEIMRFRVLNDPPLRVFYPKPSEEFTYLQGLPVIKIAWNVLDLYSSYTVQIATDPQFGSIVRTKQTQNQSLAFDDLPDGNYFLRIVAKSLNSEVKDKLSSTIPFSVERRLNLEPPVLLEPTKGKAIPKEVSKPGIFFSWRDNKDFNNFILEISSDTNFSNIISKQNLTNNFYKEVRDWQEGTYYWRVRGIVPGKEEQVSASFPFQILAKEDLYLAGPSNGADLDFTDQMTVALRWKKLSQKADYKIEIFRTGIAEPIFSGEPDQPNFYDFRPKEPGRYSWRVSAVTNLGERDVSDTWSFSLSRNVEAPILLTPTRNETIDITTKNSLLFSWKPSEGATAYEIKIFDKSSLNEKLILSERVTQTKFTINDFKKINDGKFRWEVTAIYLKAGVEKNSNPSKAEFAIVLPALSLPKIFTPGKIYVE